MIVVTGATGHYGPLAIEELLARGVPAGQIVAAARDPQKATALAARGVQVRRADYTDPESLASALSGAEKLLFVSGSEVGQRVPQHRNVVEAATAAGVRLIAYTSILNADTTGIRLADEHRATEAMIRDSGVPYVLLRNTFYLEVYTAALPQAVEHGALVEATGDGRISAATRADLAAAAAVVLTTEGHENRVYELGGAPAITLAELAAEASRQSGRPIAFRNLSQAEYVDFLAGVGVPRAAAEYYADASIGASRGDLYTDSDDLPRLLGRATTPLAEAVAAALKD
ncbi:SDR family oxidoreductase [Micromonospora sp. HM5-17]|uniref:SDR family oxidoreductase n=1 Tax=Micromonospora sp. HM5-17 TaxID=2487710 RepID=UPI000F4889EE|nr:SDR family oxidoreductase [Micromonospora sp. HM5-17]ROT26574.1 SDR family oxidoreductase [Micromonospora sp. HM5-17]